MNKLIFSFCMIFFAVSFTTQLQAQTKTCTPAQIEACKKICGTTTAANCTTAQKAACQKVCDKSASTKVADNNPLNLPAVFVGNSTTDSKKTSCGSSAKLTNNSKASCTAKKTKVAENEKTETTPIAQKVALTSEVVNN